MVNVKEQLVGFSIFIMQEFGMEKYLPKNSKEYFLNFPISGIREAARDMVEATQDISGEELVKLHKKLNEQYLPTLTDMRQQDF